MKQKQQAGQGRRPPRGHNRTSKKNSASSGSEKLGPTERSRLKKLSQAVEAAASVPFPSERRLHDVEQDPDEEGVYWRGLKSRVRTPLELISQLCRKLRLNALAADAESILESKDTCSQLIHLSSFLIPACRVEVARKLTSSDETKRVIYEEVRAVINAIGDLCSRRLTSIEGSRVCVEEAELFLRLRKAQSLLKRFKLPELWFPFKQLPPAQPTATLEMLPLLRLSILPDCRSALDDWAQKNAFDVEDPEPLTDEDSSRQPSGAQTEDAEPDPKPTDEELERPHRPDTGPFTIGLFQFHPECEWVKHKGVTYNCTRPSAKAALRFLTDQYFLGNTPVLKIDVCKAVFDAHSDGTVKFDNSPEKVNNYFKNSPHLEWIYKNVIANDKKGHYGINKRPEPQ